MRRWKWFWVSPILTVLAVGLGCQSEKPTSISSQKVSVVDYGDILLIDGIPVPKLPTYSTIGAGGHGAPVTEDMIREEAERVVYLLAKAGIFADYEVRERGYYIHEVAPCGCDLDRSSFAIIVHHDFNCAVSTETMKAEMEAAEGKRPIVIHTKLRPYRCGMPGNLNDGVQLEAVLVTTPSWCNMELINENQSPKLEQADEAVRAKIGSLGRLPTSP